MTSASTPHPMSNIVKRLLTIASIVVFTCVMIALVLQPAGTSAQEPEATLTLTITSSAGNDFMTGEEISPTATLSPAGTDQAPQADKAPQPTPTPQGVQRSAVESATNENDGPNGGTPVTYTRGYSNLNVSLYNATHLNSFLATKEVSASIDFHQECWGDPSLCKLDPLISYGNAYSARWQGKLIVPDTGEYTFQVADVDDGARLFIDSSPLITRSWTFPLTTTETATTATLTLNAGVHDITVDYENRFVSVASLEVRWRGPNFAEEIIPMANRVPECDCTTRLNCCENEVGGPINTRTGNFDYEQQDISLPALGEPLKFKRTYNSLKAGAAALGNGWTHNYNLRLSTQPGGLSFESCAGQRFSFIANDTTSLAAYQGASGVGGSITRTGFYGAYTYYLTTVNNERYTFNNAGWPIEIADAQGHTTTLTYSGTQLIRVADATGQRYLNFTYNPQGRISQISDPLSRTVQYGYDLGGNLTIVTDTLGKPWTYVYTGTLLQEIRNPANEVVERTEFDGRGRAVRQWRGTQLALQIQYLDTVDTFGLLEQTTIITDAAGGVTTDYYNSRGALIQQTNALASTGKAYDANYNPTGSIDPNGHPTSFIYTDQGRPLVITDALGSATRLQYDAQNNLTRLTDAAGSSSYYTYTGHLLTAQSDALGHTMVYTYNPQNLLVAQQDAQGRVTEYAYNLWGQRTAVTTTEGVARYEHDRVGRLITTTDTFNRVTANVYDNADRLLAVTRNYLAGQPQNYLHAYNLTTAYEYDLAGRQIAITDTLGRVNRNVYNENGQLIKTIVNTDPARAQNELDQYNITMEYGYNAAGHQILVTDTLGHVSRTDYDVQSRPVTVTTNYQDGIYDPAHPDEDIIHVTQYDPAGNAIAQIDPLGRVARTWYDAVNRVISTTSNYRPDRPQNAGGEYNLVTTYGYDATGNRILITDTLGRVTRNFYDATGRLISTTANYLPGVEPNYLNQYNLNTFYGYDESGRQYLVTNTLGLANHTAYDPVTGRPLTTTTNYADGVFNPTQPDEDVAQSTEYDVHGNPYIHRDAAGRATRTWYDALNRAISVTTNYLPGQPQNHLGQYNLVTTYGYDELGNRAWVTDTLGRVTWTQYDALNRAVTVTQNYLSGQPLAYLGQYNLVTTYEYDALGRQVATVDPLGRRTSSEFDQVGRTLAQIDPLTQRTTYAYDVLGNRTVLTDAAQHATHFEYDTLNRPITTTRYLGGTPIHEVTHYDAVGNRVETIDARGQSTTYGYDSLGRTNAITDANLHVTTFTYDPLGRRIAQTDALQHTTVFTPDRLGRQLATADPLGNITRYGYDVVGNRVVLTDANGLVTHYGYDALDRLSTVIENHSGGPQTSDRDVRTTYAYDAWGNRTVMTNARGYTTTYTYDALSRMSQTQDARGKITAYAYDAVGNHTVLTDANNKVTLYAYDALNRQTVVTYTADATTVRYAYDPIGNRTTMTDAIGTTQYVFDDLNRLTSVMDPFAQAVGYAYDAAGNRINVIYPDGKVVTYTYNAAGLMTGVIDWAGQTTAYAYDAANRLITVTLPNSIQTVYTYDNANRLIHLTHTRLSDQVQLADYIFTLDKVGNRLQVSEAMEYPGDSQAAALPPTMAEAIVEAITGYRVPGLSAPAMTGTLVSLLPSPRPRGEAVRGDADGEQQPLAVHDPLTVLGGEQRDASRSLAALTDQTTHSSTSASLRFTSAQNASNVLGPLAGPGDIFADGFESGNFSAWSAAVTNTGRLSVIPSAARWGAYGMRALITSTTAMYVRDDTSNAESRYRARFYFHPNSISMTSGQAHYIFTGRTGSTDVLRIEFRYSTPNYQVRAQLINDSTTYSSTTWYTIANAWHAIEIDWQAATAAGANNGYITLWIDGALKQTVSGMDNDTRRVDEARLGPSSGIDSGTNGTEYFDAFESRRDTYIGPVALADFTASPVIGIAPLTVTFTNTSQPTPTLTAYLWNFGDGYASTITNPVHSYAANGAYTVTLTAWTGTDHDTITRTRLITVAEVIFQDGFESGNLAAWSAAVTNTGRLSVTPAAAQSGLYGLRALITSTTAMYVRDDTPLAEPRYRARFYFHPNSLTMTSGNAHYLLAGRTGSIDVLYVEFRYSTPNYQIRAQLRNDSTTYSSTSWFTISNDWHFIEIDWKASSAPGANNGYLTLWIDGAQQGSITGIDNDTRRVDEARLGPLSGLDSGTSGTEYFDVFESRRTTYIGPAGVVAAFNASPLSGTAPLTVTFTNASQPAEAITSYLWNFGDGFTSTITNPVHSYLPGYYTVTLTAWAGAEVSTITKTNFITATVKANFTASPVSGTGPLTVTFTNTSQPAGAITSYLWNFGDGVTSTITNPVHAYTVGYFTVTLTAWSGSMKDVITRTRFITSTPQVDFSGSPTSGSTPLAVSFTNASQPAGAITSYLWKFGDGVTSTLTNPAHTYSAQGTYTVALTAYSAVGATTFTRTSYIVATAGTGEAVAISTSPANNEVTPAVAYNTSAQEYLVVWGEYDGQFDIYARRVLSTGLPSGSAFAVNTASGSQQAPRVTYGGGVYLVVWEDNDTNLVRGQIVQASGMLSGTAFTIGSGGTDNNAPAIDYNPMAGEFLVTWVYDTGDNDIWAQRVNPSGQLAGAAFAVADQPGHELSPALTHDAAGTYLVVFLCDDSSQFGLCGQRVSSNGTLSGSRFSVFDGASTTSNQPDLAYDPIQDSYLVAWRETTGGANDEIWVRMISSNGATLGAAQALGAQTTDPFGPAVAYQASNDAYLVVWADWRNDNWDAYGRTVDGEGTPLSAPTEIEATTADQTDVTVSEQGAGYELFVAYTDTRDGSQDIYGERYNATGANFRAAPRSGLAPLTVVFTDTSTAPQPITSWLWTFGDGVTSTLQHPTHLYNSISYFTVTLETWAGALHNAVVKPNYIAAAAQAGFTLNPVQGEAPLVVNFNNTSQPSAAITSYLWDFGDGNTSTLTNPLHIYAAYGIYTPTLTAYSAGGASTLVQPAAITVWPHPGDAIAIATGWPMNETRPSLVYNADAQEYLVVWDEWNSEYDVHARRVAATGLPVGASFPITTASGDQQNSKVAYGSGVYLVVWSDNSAIWGQRVSASGTLNGSAFPISSGGNSNTAPAVDYNPATAEFLVVWNRGTEGIDYVQAQRVTTSGVLTGSPIDIVYSYQAYSPAVAHAANGVYVVVFQCLDSGNFGVCGQRLSGSGSLLGSVFSIYDATSNSGMLEVVYNPNRNEYLVTWREWSGGASDPIYARRLSSTGAVLGNVIVFTASSGDLCAPSLAYDAATQQYVMVWADDGSGDWNIGAQTLRADGSALDHPTPLVVAGGNQGCPAISRQGPADDHYMVYSDDRAGTADVYGQRYLPPQARFSAHPASGTAPLTVLYQDRSTTPEGGSWLWNFGDGATSTEQNPAHTYTTLGQFTTVLTRTWWDTPYVTSHEVTVLNPVLPQFTASPLYGTHPLTVTFADQSTTFYGTVNAWLWDFGDGVTSTLQQPTHVYPNNGLYDVTLTAGTGAYTNTLTQARLIAVGPPHRTVINYTYDGLYRLTKADSTGAMTTTFQYAYDAVGNRTAQTATITSTQVTNYIYDPANRLTSVNGQAYTWDDNGNLVNDGVTTHAFDQANRLISITVGIDRAQFRYNGDGVRLGQALSRYGGQQWFTYENNIYAQDWAAPLPLVLQKTNLLEEVNPTTTYLYALGTRPLAQYGTSWEYLLADALGSVRQIVDGSGNVTLAESYEPYGSVLSSNGTASSIFGYAGEQIDTTGLIYLRARYMQPTLGIFLARDPWSGDTMRPGSMNGYSYAEGNPIGYIDPTGRFRICIRPFDIISKLQAATLIKRYQTAGVRLYMLFADDFHECNAWLCAGSTAADRLDFVLDFTQGINVGVPSLGFPAQFNVDFGGDTGLAEEFRDSKYYKGNNPQSGIWEGSTNQPGHFLTAVALSYRGLPEAFHLFFWSPATDPARKVSYEDRIALGLIVGHEKVSDQQITEPPLISYIRTAQAQYWSASEQDINDFMDAVEADARGDKQTRDDIFWRILGPTYKQNIQNRVGNSIEDLRLSAKGWRFGKWVLSNKNAPSWSAADWLLENILGGWIIASSSP